MWKTLIFAFKHNVQALNHVVRPKSYHLEWEFGMASTISTSL